MKPIQHLSFKAGQNAESKSFLNGFRGAWFRCEILKSGYKSGKAGHFLKFYDFSEDKPKWEQLYKKDPKKAPTDGVSRQEREQLMLRPSFPSICFQNKMPDVSTISEVVAIVDEVWKVGDLVDWYKDSSYWSGRITQILDKDKVQIELLEPPMGEGGSYEASFKDLRPSLNWSPEHGWTVPESKGSETRRYCTRLIHPLIRDEGDHDGVPTMEASCELSVASVTSHGSGGSLPPPEISSHPSVSEMQKEPPSGVASVTSHGSGGSLPPPEISSHPSLSEMQKEPPSGSSLNEEAIETPYTNTDDSMEKTSFSDSVSCTQDKEAFPATGTTTGRDRYSYSASSKKMKTSENQLNSTCSDTIESSILDLEELINRVKWLRGALDLGFHFANKTKPSWEFLENRSSMTDR